MPARQRKQQQAAPAQAASMTGNARDAVPPDVQQEADALLCEYLQRKKLDLEAAASTVRRLHDSDRARDHQVHRCVLQNMLGEWPLLPRYPDKELKLSGRLFGRLVQMGLTISDGLLALMLRHTFEALRLGCSGLSPKLLTWGIAALREFVGRLHHWPAYCAHFLGLADQLAKSEPELEAAVRGAWTAAQKMTAAKRAKRDSLLALSPSPQGNGNGHGNNGMPSLQQLLAGLGLQKYAERLEANEIDLEAIALCADADFAEMEIPKGPRVKIAHALRQLEAKQAASTPTKTRPAVSVQLDPRLSFTSSVLPNGTGDGGGAAAAGAGGGSGSPLAAAAAAAASNTKKGFRSQPKGWGRLPAANPVPIAVSSGVSPVAQWAKTSSRQEPEPEPEISRGDTAGELETEDLLRMKSAEGEALVMDLIDSFDDDGWGRPSSSTAASAGPGPVGAAGGGGGVLGDGVGAEIGVAAAAAAAVVGGESSRDPASGPAEPWMLNGGAFWCVALLLLLPTCPALFPNTKMQRPSFRCLRGVTWLMWWLTWRRLWLSVLLVVWCRGGGGSMDESPVKTSSAWENWGTAPAGGGGGGGGLPVTPPGPGSRGTSNPHYTAPRHTTSCFCLARAVLMCAVSAPACGPDLYKCCASCQLHRCINPFLLHAVYLTMIATAKPSHSIA